MTQEIRQFINTIPDKRVASAMANAFNRILPTNLDTAITAKAGGVQATATLLKSTTAYHHVTVCATAADAVALPPARVGELHIVKNSGAASMQVFGSGIDTVDSVATATGVAQAAGDTVMYYCLTDGNYLRFGGLDATEIFGAITVNSIAGGDSSLGIDGQAAAQGGAVVVTGGASSTATNAGGAVTYKGGAGNTSGAGGAANLTGGVPGVTGAGGAANIAGGAGGATSGIGGAVTVSGGAGTAGNASGGSVIVTPGAKHGSGLDGNLVFRTGAVWFKQSAATADNVDTPYTMTAAEMLGGISSMTPTQGRAVTTLTGAQIEAAISIIGLAADDAFEFSVQNRAAFAATDDILTLTAGASGVTVTGSAVISPGSTARFRCRRTAVETYIIHKIAG